MWFQELSSSKKKNIYIYIYIYSSSISHIDPLFVVIYISNYFLKFLKLTIHKLNLVAELKSRKNKGSFSS